MSNPFKQADIKPCAICCKGLMHAGIPLFYRLRVERMGLDLGAIKRQHGLELMMGGAAPLASIMGPDETMAAVIDGPRELLVCETCSHEMPALLNAFLSGDSDG